MSDSFIRRWASRKTDHAKKEGSTPDADRLRMPAADSGSGPGGADNFPPAGQSALPTMKDVASLAPDSDYSTFLARGVDKAVRRAAMKKLFSDPHFNVMDGLDIYIDDYTKPSPLPPGMLAGLLHAKSTLEPTPLYKTQGEEDRELKLTEKTDESEESGVPNETRSGGVEPADDARAREDENEVSSLQADMPTPTEREASQRPRQLLSQETPNHSTGPSLP